MKKEWNVPDIECVELTSTEYTGKHSNNYDDLYIDSDGTMFGFAS